MTLRTLPLLLLLAACGGSSPAPKTPAPDAPDDGLAAGDTPAPAADRSQEVCDGIVALSQAGCEFLQGYDASSCVEEFRAAGPDPVMTSLADCFVGTPTCESAERCVDDVMIAEMMANAPPREAPTGPYLSKSPSTKDTPIEVCMPEGEMEWLFEARCDDDSNPFVSLDHAHGARVGSVGAGQSGNVIDLYEVRCPEKTYEVFMDMYAGC